MSTCWRTCGASARATACNMRPPLSKPFRADSIRHIVTSAHLAESPLTVVGLDEALAKGWLELWYQPKIDLAAKRSSAPRG